MNSLLTPNEVAQLLQLSMRTVYAQSHRLGGFYPAGIRALRFRREDIYAIMEGPQERTLEVPVSTPGPASRQIRVQDKKTARREMEKHRESLEMLTQPIPPSSPTPCALDLETLMVEYLRVAERQLAPKTLEYRKIVFRRFLGRTKNIPAPQVTTRVVEDYLLARLPTTTSTRTARNSCACSTGASNAS